MLHTRPPQGGRPSARAPVRRRSAFLSTPWMRGGRSRGWTRWCSWVRARAGGGGWGATAQGPDRDCSEVLACTFATDHVNCLPSCGSLLPLVPPSCNFCLSCPPPLPCQATRWAATCLPATRCSTPSACSTSSSWWVGGVCKGRAGSVGWHCCMALLHMASGCQVEAVMASHISIACRLWLKACSHGPSYLPSNPFK